MQYEKSGKLYSTTSSPSGAYFVVWDRYPGTVFRRPDRFALYAADGAYIDRFGSAVEAERTASFRLLDIAKGESDQ